MTETCTPPVTKSRFSARTARAGSQNIKLILILLLRVNAIIIRLLLIIINYYWARPCGTAMLG